MIFQGFTITNLCKWPFETAIELLSCLMDYPQSKGASMLIICNSIQSAETLQKSKLVSIDSIQSLLPLKRNRIAQSDYQILYSLNSSETSNLAIP